MDEKELLEKIAYRFGLNLGLKTATSSLRREVREHSSTLKIVELKKKTAAIEKTLIFEDLSPEERKKLRASRYEKIEEITKLKTQREEDTMDLRNKCRDYRTVIAWMDEEVIEPELEAKNLLKPQEPSKEEIEKAREWKAQQVKKKK